MTRKTLPHQGPTIQELIDEDSAKWSDKIKELKPAPNAFVTAIGTTRAQAGSFAKQREIDHDLNLALAKAAHENGSKIGLLISSAGTSPKSNLPYSKLKGDVEEAFKAIGFSHTIIVRPGLLIGERNDTRLAEAFLRKIASGFGAVSQKLVDFWAQDAQVIARASVSSVAEAAEGKREEGLWVIEQADIVRLGRTEWKES